MESDGVFRIYQQTFAAHNIYYNSSIANGDSSTFTSVCKAQPYNSIVLEQKWECVNYVTTHMGSKFEKSNLSLWRKEAPRW